MFEFGRELRRMLGATGEAPRDGVTGGDPSMFELLDLPLLRAEAKAADVAAGRVSAKDPAARRLAAARAWREVARRSGDAVALRKAAAEAAEALSAFQSSKRPAFAAMARVEQARCACLGAELFNDPGLEAAAETALKEAAAAPGPAAPLARAELAALWARRTLKAGDAREALIKLTGIDAPSAALAAAGSGEPALRHAAYEYRLSRAELTTLCGGRLKDADVLTLAVGSLAKLATELDEAYEPLLRARVRSLQGFALCMLGETIGDVGPLADGAAILADVVELFTPEDSPLDWARAQLSLAVALQTLGEATGPAPLEAALNAFDRALAVLAPLPGLALRAQASNNRAVCLARCAEVTGDLASLDAAETAFRIELERASPSVDPAPWAVAQLNLARLYEARISLTGRDDGYRDRAAFALAMALEVFAEQGLRSLAVLAQDGLERLKATA